MQTVLLHPHPLCDDLNPVTYAYCSQTVTVNDDYAFANRTHIAGMGGVPAGDGSNLTCGSVKVSIGYVKVKYQYDDLISFTHNGGGPEMMFGVVEPNQPLPRTSFKRVVYQPIGRKEVRLQEWVSVWRTLDESWDPAALTELFGIYEWDNTSTTKYFSGQLTWQDGSGTSYPSYNVGVNTKNNLIYTLSQQRSSIVYLAQTYGHTPEYQTGYGPQFSGDKGNVLFSLPIACY